MSENNLTISDLCKKFNKVDVGVIETCFESGFQKYKNILNIKIIDAIQKIDRFDPDVIVKINLIMSLADKD